MGDGARTFIKDLSILCFSMNGVWMVGIESVMEITLKTTMRFCPTYQHHLNFAIDGFHSEYAPRTGAPVPGGLLLDGGKCVCKNLGLMGSSEQLLAIMLQEKHFHAGAEACI
ncbi:Arginase [Taenia solium]|eukprot:TsM_000332900 transcript=TsM_000332900 gene=TsM_000332900